MAGTLSAEWEAWSAPFLADPFDEAASAARTAQTRRVAAGLMAVQVGTRVGSLTVVSAGWSRERAAQADAAAEPGSKAWFAALGAHEHVTLTADGRSANRQEWCQCPEDGHWAFYEGWTADGRTAHGFVHAVCRRLVQTG